MKADALTSNVLAQMQVLDNSEQMTLFVNMMTATLISVMRGIHDEQFVKDYLTAALNDTNAPVITPHLRQ